MSNLNFYLALNRMNQVGPRTVAKLLKRWPNLEEMFKLSSTALLQTGLPPALVKTIKDFDMNQVAADLSWQAASQQHHILTWDNPDYPDILKEIADPPVVIYAKGDLSCLQKRKLAVVGSRNPSITGKENARNFSRELTKYDLCIVSGLALGIDAEAHEGCLEVKGRTIAVLGTGIDYIYPRRHEHLAQEICEKGLLISEFPLQSPPIAGHFPRRNRIISGLSLSILVIEAAIKSGSLITARMAIEQNRDVLAIPGSIHNPMARGCHYLLQQGAKLVTSVSDVLEELNLSPTSSIDKSRNLLAMQDENLVKFIGFETTTIDQILARSGQSLMQVTTELVELELQGKIQSVPGGYLRYNNER